MPGRTSRWAASACGAAALCAALWSGLYPPACGLLWIVYQALVASHPRGAGEPQALSVRRIPAFLLDALPVAVGLAALWLIPRVALVSGDGLEPAVLTGEAVAWADAGAAPEPRRGDWVIYRAGPDGPERVGRVLGLPGEAVWSPAHTRCCVGASCLDSVSIGTETADAGGREAVASVLGGAPLVTFRPGPLAAAPGIEPETLGAGQFLLAVDSGPDSRSCGFLPRVAAVDADSILGRPGRILYSSSLRRIGLAFTP
jgi:hypothetical protein